MLQVKNTFKILPFLFLLGCITPLDIQNDSFEKVLVVEGRVTTDVGPHIIRITESAKYGSVFQGVIEPVETATVFIRDNQGDVTTLRHTEGGKYETPAGFRGVVGFSYILTIEYNGTTYNSSQEQLTKVNEIDSVYTVYSQYPFLNENDILNYNTGVDLYARYKKDPAASNYMYWDYEGIYYLRTFPELFTITTRRGPVASPKDCCAECFRSESNSELIISSFPLGRENVDAKLFFLQDNGYRFLNKYVMVLKRYSLSREAFQFYELIQQQLEIDGDVFDPPPVTIRGNIYNTEDAEEVVVGYFVVSDVASDTISIETADLDDIQPLPTFKDDCRVLSNTTTTVPDLWLLN